MWHGLLGTYTTGRSEGIYSFTLDEKLGTLGEISLFTPIENAKYLAKNQKHLFSLYSEEGRGGVAVFDFQGNLLSSLLFESGVPCHILVEQEFIYCTNYHLGTVNKLSYVSGQLKLLAQTLIQEKAGAHQLISYENRLYVPCLHLDKIVIFSQELQVLGEILLPPGAGCRHGIVGKEQELLYILGELSNEIYCISLNDGKILSQISILPPGVESTEGGSALRRSEDGKRLFASTRGEVNGIAVVEIQGETMEMTRFFSSEGNHPRDILNICQDRYLLVANQHSDSLVVFDCENNYKITDKVTIPEGVALIERN